MTDDSSNNSRERVLTGQQIRRDHNCEICRLSYQESQSASACCGHSKEKLAAKDKLLRGEKEEGAWLSDEELRRQNLVLPTREIPPSLRSYSPATPTSSTGSANSHPPTSPTRSNVSGPYTDTSDSEDDAGDDTLRQEHLSQFSPVPSVDDGDNAADVPGVNCKQPSNPTQEAHASDQECSTKQDIGPSAPQGIPGDGSGGTSHTAPTCTTQSIPNDGSGGCNSDPVETQDEPFALPNHRLADPNLEPDIQRLSGNRNGNGPQFPAQGFHPPRNLFFNPFFQGTNYSSPGSTWQEGANAQLCDEEGRAAKGDRPGHYQERKICHHQPKPESATKK
jgi:hypothetical protein